MTYLYILKQMPLHWTCHYGEVDNGHKVELVRTFTTVILSNNVGTKFIKYRIYLLFTII